MKMRKFMLVVTIMILGASFAFAADFTPTQLKLSAPGMVHYEYDGSTLGIPVKAAGVGGSGVLFVYTKDQAESIEKIQNGHLGWHFVNQIDTCVYVAPAQDISVGDNVFEWNGKDSDGNAVAAGEYNYYVWAFDNKNSKVPASRVTWGMGWVAPDVMITKGEDGNPLTRPVLYQSGTDCCNDDSEPTEKIHRKWVIGSDPDDATLIETTSAITWRNNSRIDILPTDHSKWFMCTEKPSGIIEIQKRSWVPNGASEIQTDWAENGIFEWTLPEKYNEYHFSVLIPEGSDDLLFPNMNHQTAVAICDLVYLDLEEGTYKDKIDLSDWWVNVDEGAQYAEVATVGGPTDLYPGKNGELSLNAHGTCLVHVIDPYRDGDIHDKTLYVNGNGDSFLDTNYQEDAERPWACNDPWGPVFKYALDLDSNGFTAACTYAIGAISFGLLGPDGTEGGYHAYAGEQAGWGKASMFLVDYGSAYDGLYTQNNTSQVEEDRTGIWYVGQDSIKGVITSATAVADAPSSFAVAQNSPNPFNPTTTIGFTVPEAGTVSVDVFNVAGQKIDTIANDFMSAGSHSVTWDAAGYSAGIYFYTVKAGDFSKTMKMSLIK
ncbi:T9SS type A sorting domain-containing protein [Candidatus Latescibacterota bacterium]